MIMKRLGHTGSLNVEVWESEDGRRFCTSEWNGEMWGECWEVFPDMTTGQSFEARPIYRFELEGIDISSLEENSDEWFRATEVIGLDF